MLGAPLIIILALQTLLTSPSAVTSFRASTWKVIFPVEGGRSSHPLAQPYRIHSALYRSFGGKMEVQTNDTGDQCRYRNWTEGWRRNGGNSNVDTSQRMRSIYRSSDN
ncbi:hypothetical protein F4604DRAFT_997970 [Suillus subluteus]|nr:hypothetical protein F4604DRAFT_997970 [Suillus subluteus]